MKSCARQHGQQCQNAAEAHLAGMTFVCWAHDLTDKHASDRCHVPAAQCSDIQHGASSRNFQASALELKTLIGVALCELVGPICECLRQVW
jgi:hypothetical protein